MNVEEHHNKFCFVAVFNKKQNRKSMKFYQKVYSCLLALADKYNRLWNKKTS
jgi:hypothetical protein